MKRCIHCGVEKPLVEFYRHKQMADGHLNKCKTCSRRHATANRNARLEEKRAYDRMRYRRDPYRHTQVKGFWQRINPIQKRCYRITSNALRDGRLKRGLCEDCGSEKVEAHHDDYEKPFEVRWLCRRHHIQLHKFVLPD